MDPGGFSASPCSVGASRTQTGLIILKNNAGPHWAWPCTEPRPVSSDPPFSSVTLLFMEDHHPFSFLKELSRTWSVGNRHKCGLLRHQTAYMGHLCTPRPGHWGLDAQLTPSSSIRKPSKGQLWKKEHGWLLSLSSEPPLTSRWGDTRPVREPNS